MISIIIPVYNAENYLHTCIYSVLNQTYNHFELLLINDGSKDDSPQICDKYASIDERVKVFHQENAGVSAARNRGLTNAQGEYICFVDADDFIEPNFLEKISSEIEITNGDFIYFGYQEINENEKRNSVKNPTEIFGCGKHALKKILSFNISITPWMCAINNNVIRKNNLLFTEGCRYGEDQEFVYKTLVHCKNVVTIKASLYNYRVWHGSVMAKATLLHFDFVDAMKRVKKYLEIQYGPEDMLVEWFDRTKVLTAIVYSVKVVCQSGVPIEEILIEMKNRALIPISAMKIFRQDFRLAIGLFLMSYLPKVYLKIVFRMRHSSAVSG